MVYRWCEKVDECHDLSHYSVHTSGQTFDLILSCFSIKMSFLQLPIEIRLNIYSELFGEGIVYIDGGRQDVSVQAKDSCMLPTFDNLSRRQTRSAQLLRTCKMVLDEARPILYRNTIFRTSFQAFAGRLPSRMTSSNPSYAHVRNLEWGLACDILKKYDSDDVQIAKEEVQHLRTIQLVCQSESWRDSFCGEWVDRQTFVRGRQQVIDFAKHLQAKMSNERGSVTLVEDCRHLSRGRVVLRLFRGRRGIAADEMVIT